MNHMFSYLFTRHFISFHIFSQKMFRIPLPLGVTFCEKIWNCVQKWNWCEMKSSVWNRVWKDVNGYEWIWKNMKWISVRDSQCEQNTSILRLSKFRQTGAQLADLIRITRKVFKFSKCCCTPKANALAGSAAVPQLPSVRKLLIALECLENGRETWSHSSAC